MTAWSARIRDLQKSGMTYQEIGEAIDLTGSAVGDIAVGRTKAPSGEAALKLHALHQQRCPPPRRHREARAGAAR